MRHLLSLFAVSLLGASAAGAAVPTSLPAALEIARAAVAGDPQPEGGSAPEIKAAGPAISVVKLEKKRLIVRDGDTIRYGFTEKDGVRNSEGGVYTGAVRLIGFDTPETPSPEYGILFPQEKGPEATERLREMVKAAKAIEIHYNGQTDRGGRLLGYLVIDGRNVGADLVREGLAYATIKKWGDQGFPKKAQEVREAWAESPIKKAIDEGRPPAFEQPYIWKRHSQFRSIGISWDDWNQMGDDAREKLQDAARTVAEYRRGGSKWDELGDDERQKIQAASFLLSKYKKEPRK